MPDIVTPSRRFFQAELFSNLCACRHKVLNELRVGQKERRGGKEDRRREREKREDIIKLAGKLVLERTADREAAEAF